MSHWRPVSRRRGVREERLAGTGLTPLFRFGADTPRTARMIAAGLGAIITSDEGSRSVVCGPEFDAPARRSAAGGPCGERGEFHSFAYRGPMFRTPITVTLGEIVDRDGFTFADVKPTSGSNLTTCMTR